MHGGADGVNGHGSNKQLVPESVPESVPGSVPGSVPDTLLMF